MKTYEQISKARTLISEAIASSTSGGSLTITKSQLSMLRGMLVALCWSADALHSKVLDNLLSGLEEESKTPVDPIIEEIVSLVQKRQ